MPLAVLTPRNIDLEPGTWTDALPPRQFKSKYYLAKCNHISHRSVGRNSPANGAVFKRSLIAGL
jgi:hypothetical protein